MAGGPQTKTKVVAVTYDDREHMRALVYYDYCPDPILAGPLLDLLVRMSGDADVIFGFCYLVSDSGVTPEMGSSQCMKRGAYL